MKAITDELFKLADPKYKEFHSSLVPNVDASSLIGVRVPNVRKLAKEFSKTGDVKGFFAEVPHTYYEENNLHMYLIETIKDYDECVYEIEKFLPYINNGGVCDGHSFKPFEKNKDRLFIKIKEWVASKETYTIRFGLNMLMRYFLDDDFTEECNDIAAAVTSEEYYVNMMVAWYFATALAKQYDATIGYIEDKKLSIWTHNKTIQKAIESYRITNEQKDYLRTLRIK